jgi:hypothetical protein
MKSKFAGEMPDFDVDPITRRGHSRQISREHIMEAMNILYSRTVQDTDEVWNSTHNSGA